MALLIGFGVAIAVDSRRAPKQHPDPATPPSWEEAIAWANLHAKPPTEPRIKPDSKSLS